jgi:hypothetical protein
MTPIDNAVLSEILDNALSDLEYMRQERNLLREAKAEATAEAYELRQELREAYKLNDQLVELQRDLQQRAIARADENAHRLVEADQQLKLYKEALRLSIRETSDLEDQLALYQENCECSR